MAGLDDHEDGHEQQRYLDNAVHMHVNGIIKVALLFMSIFMIVKASHEERYSLPIIGELAEKSVSER